jgi:hypothetical protein
MCDCGDPAFLGIEVRGESVAVIAAQFIGGQAEDRRELANLKKQRIGCVVEVKFINVKAHILQDVDMIDIGIKDRLKNEIGNDIEIFNGGCGQRQRIGGANIQCLGVVRLVGENGLEIGLQRQAVGQAWCSAVF